MMFKTTFVTLLSLTVVAIFGIGIVIAAPSGQGGAPIPTLTPPPVDVAALDYTLSMTEPVNDALTAPGNSADGITISDTRYLSDYPTEMRFEVSASSENGPLASVTMFVLNRAGERIDRIQADYDSAADVYSTSISGDYVPAWRQYTLQWSVTDAADVNVRTEPFTVVYRDDTRVWTQLALPEATVYWLSVEREDAAFAEQVASEYARLGTRLVAVFGDTLPYTPTVTLYPDFETYIERVPAVALDTFQSQGAFDANFGDISTYFGGVPGITPVDRFGETCQYVSSAQALNPVDELVNELSNWTANLYANEYDVAQGPSWWVSVFNEWFSPELVFAPNRRLSNLAAINPILDPLSDTNAIPLESVVADGCTSLAVDVGLSFMDWFVLEYGIETLPVVMEETRAGFGPTAPIEAIESVTGEAFIDIENRWRARIGFDQLLPDVSTVDLLEPAPNAPYQPGDTVTIPGPQPVPVFPEPEEPIASIQCFPGLPATILQVGTLNGVDWYEIDCSGIVGWTTIDGLE